MAVASHPIQYHAPWFRALAQASEIDFFVLFIQRPDARQQGAGFGVAFEWDIPLLEGYRWQDVFQLRGSGGLQGFFSARIPRPFAFLRSLEVDAVVLTGWHVWPLVQLLIAAWWTGVPVVMRGESNALRRRPWFARLLHRFLLRCCSAFLPIGQASRDFYRDYGISDQRMFATPYFVDNARFAAAAAECMPRRSELRTSWQIPAGAVCFCYVGKLEPKKRILDLLAALHAAREQSALPLHVLVVGSGELAAAARAYVSRFSLPATFAGFLNQTEIPRAYVAADCLVLPSDYGETWGLVVNEAMACGRPAIVSDRVGCGPDLIVEGETGAVVPFGDVHALATRMVQLANNADLHAMGEKARERVTQSYSVECGVTGTLAAIRYVLTSK